MEQEKVTTYQIGRAEVRIHGDPDRLDREKLKGYFARFMTQVYRAREEKNASKDAEETNQGA